MYKKICDRCGAEIKKEGNDNELDNKLHFTKKRNTRYGYDNLFHLCDDCLNEFDKFMEAKK